MRTHWRLTLLDSSGPKYDNTREYIVVELRYESDIILIAVVYRRPTAASPIDFFDVLAPYPPNNKHVTTTGDYIRNAVEESKLTILILFDFSKAFDSIPHRRLMQKSRAYHLSDPATTWLYSYLCDRYQAVINEGGTITSWCRPASGVPQGSILEPLLFALYINDIPRILIRVMYMPYTDDMQIYQSFELEQIDAGISHMQLTAKCTGRGRLSFRE